ncbi:F-box/FBD/LRR-repeat protein At3g14710-like [Prunus avium]|uniref:F-box/FBD/LRR-repeat protein At3g14710-like n=1 Tax=Prunus avium TaxID=42229 RepID=A0A6P5RU91_PRUAV|nr:F-box/FBD/LRR-repeat protein At3g14710-like [Prunus avium]
MAMDPKRPHTSHQVAPGQGSSNSMDRISELEEGILGSIVSRLTQDEILDTRSLFRIWRSVWAYSTILNSSDEYRFSEEELEPEREREIYDNFVNRVVENHNGGHVEEFMAFFHMENDRSKNATFGKWLEFTERNGVQKVMLILLDDGIFSSSMNLAYASSPHEFIGNYKLKHECNGVSDIPHPCKYGGFKFVKSISLFGVVTVGEAFKCLLGNCKFLEKVLLSDCGGFGYKVRVVGPALALKYLEIRNCRIESIEISCANLVSFTYAGDWIRLFLWNVPRLAEVSLACDSRASTVSVFSKLHSCHPQLEVLTLKTSLIHKENYTFPGLEILKHLEVKIATDEDCCLLQLASFIKASPELQKLVLELTGVVRPGRGIGIKEAANCSHNSLREVEVRDYRGRPGDDKLIMYLIENAVKLEKIVMHPNEERAVDPYMRQLKRQVPKHINFVRL